jgi:two-component system KDP operon response regulator KdpE
MQMRILVVDDAPQIRRVLKGALAAQDYDVLTASNGEEALDRFRQFSPNVTILDLGLPKMNGAEVCREIRKLSAAPIIVLSVRSAEQEKVAALDAGADDYVTKPFGMDELLARIRSVLRRVAPMETTISKLKFGDVSIDLESRIVTRDGREVRLTPKDFELLRYLLMNAGKVVTHRTLLQAVWGPDSSEQAEYVRTFVNQLRRKIEPDPSSPRFILTDPWVGYRLVLPDTE